MHHFKIPLAIAVGLLFHLRMAHADDELRESCRPVLLTISESPATNAQTSLESAKVFINCNGSDFDIPRNTALHMMLAKPEGFCYADYSCGNLEAWHGRFSVGVAAGFGDTLGNFLVYGLRRISIPTSPLTIHVSMGIEWIRINTYCTEMGEPICFPYR